jgi:hypothetical protein
MKLSDSLLSLIEAERLSRFASLNLPDDWLTPNYDGRCIVNVPSSIVSIFGGQMRTAPLDAAILDGFTAGVKRIVLVVIDALGYYLLLNALKTNPHNGFHALLRNGARLVPLTSVFPSTTTAALTSLWTGYTPAEHGSLGYTLFLRQQSVRADVISFSPYATAKLGKEQLVAAGFEPETFLPVPSLPQTLEKIGVSVYNLIEQPYVKSALSRAQIRAQRETRGVIAISDLWVNLREWLQERQHERALFVAYWSAVDTLAHKYGPSSPTINAEIQSIAYSFEREFLQPLSAQARDGTLWLLTADHGQLDTPPARAVSLRAHPELTERLLFMPTGEARAAYLHCVTGEVAATRDYLQARLGAQFVVVDSRAALEAGLFGRGSHAPETRHRLGDLLVLSRHDHILWDGTEPPQLLGRHGGLTVAEMLVPLLVARLDA